MLKNVDCQWTHFSTKMKPQKQKVSDIKTPSVVFMSGGFATHTNVTNSKASSSQVSREN